MIHKGTQTIETERLLLRRFSLNDAKPMFDNWASDDEVTKFLTWESHSDISVTEAIISQWVSDYENKEFYSWAISLKDNPDNPIGSISVVEPISDKICKAHIGYCISKKHWHKGITSEALDAVINFLFNVVGVNKIEARHDPNNPNSGKVMKKCGMKFEGTLRQTDWNNQGICDACWYGLLKSERC
ncbi:MAG: GNAT family N-acetyltransferase [Lachnospiraceae bacterium]|nr:GNAT family N-acetyltransferase [Lachnospiraceae bacterium]